MATTSLNFSIRNKSGVSSDNVFIGFWGDSLNAEINGIAMKTRQWYQLSTITSMQFDATTSGRIYITYQDSNATPTFSPEESILSSSSEAYNQCFDKFEFTFDGSTYAVADLTAIDFWSIPMSLQTQKSGSKVEELYGVKSGYTVNDIYKGLQALSNPVQSGSTANAIIKAFENANSPLPTGIQSDLQEPASGLVNSKVNSKVKFVRIIGPNSYPPFGNPAQKDQPPGLPFTPYDTFMDYFQYLKETFGPGKKPTSPFTKLGNGKIAYIAGSYGGNTRGSGNACSAQSYDLWAAIDDNYNLTLSGTGDAVGKITIQVSQWNLLAPASTYGGNPMFCLNGGELQSPQNDLYGWILGDFFAGLNIGALGSKMEVDNQVVGEMSSSQWFAILPKKEKDKKKMLFNNLWDSGKSNYWNQWAAVLNPMSDAYNFAYSERFSAPQISLNPHKVDTLILTLLALPTLSA